MCEYVLASRCSLVFSAFHGYGRELFLEDSCSNRKGRETQAFLI
jgi:hypothetical protein